MVLLALFRAGVSTFYIIQVALLAILTAGGYNIPQIKQLFTEKPFRQWLIIYEAFVSFTVELSLQLILLKILTIQLIKMLGGFNYTLCWLLYFVDIGTIFGLAGHLYGMLKEKELAEITIRLIDKQNSKHLQSFMSFDQLKNLINPFWRPSGITIHPNITYATNEEIKEALNATNQDFDQPRKLMLDVITKDTKSVGLRPVLFHVHGGAWKRGHKNIFYPYQKLLVPEDNWVIVNIGYRLAPKNAYPTHLIDVKRALRWTKENISSFGGDPNFIVAIGDSAGGHLSAMAALTTNDPKYQPGFENIDTSLRAVISVNGVLDLFHDNHSTAFFSKQIAGLSTVDTEFIHQHSPASLVKTAKTIVPFLCIASERDSLVKIQEATNFKINYDERRQSSCTLAIAPAGHHISYLFWSPRSLYFSRIIQAWCRQLQENRIN